MAGLGSQIHSMFVSLKMSTLDFAKGAEAVSLKAKSLEKKLGRIGNEMSKKISAPLAAFGTAAAYSFLKIDDAQDKIRISTGATGKKLEGLQKSFIKAFRGTPSDINDVATAISEISTRTGASGEILDKYTNSILTFSRITGTDLSENVVGVTRLMANWQISNEEATSTMDVLLKTSELTGIKIGDLTDKMTSSGVTLRQYGYSFSEAAALIGTFEKAGLDIEKVLGSLQKGFASLTSKGQSPKQFLSELVEGFKATGDRASLNSIAVKIFGKTAGQELAEAIATGRFELTEFNKELQNSSGAIEKARKDTDGFAELFVKLRNKLETALSPIGEVIIKAIEPAMESLGKLLDAVYEKLSTLNPETLKFAVGLGAVVAGIGPLLLGLKGLLGVVSLLLSPIGLTTVAVVGLSAAIVYLGTVAYDNFDILTLGARDLQANLAFAWNKIQIGVVTLALTIKKKLLEIKLAMNEFMGDAEGVSEALNKLGETDKSLTQLSKGTHELQVEQKFLKQELAGYEKVRTEANKAEATAKDGVVSLTEETKKHTDTQNKNSESIKTGGGSLEELAEGLGKTKNKTAELRHEWELMVGSFESDTLKTSLTEGLEEAAKNLDKNTFDSLALKLREAIGEEAYKDLKEKYKDAIPDSTIREQANHQAEIQTQVWSDKWNEAQKQAYEEGIEFWETTFENAITGKKFDLEDMFEQVAVGFAAKLAQAIFGSIEGVKNPKDLGGSIFDSIFGDSLGGGSGGGGFNIWDLFKGSGNSSSIPINFDIFGNGTTPSTGSSVLTEGPWSPEVLEQAGASMESAAGSLQGIQGMLGNIFQGANTTGGYVAAGIAAFDDLIKIGQSTEESIKGVGSAAGAAIGAAFGGPVGAQVGQAIGKGLGKGIVKVFGLGGPTHPETLKRIEAEKHFEKIMESVGGIMVKVGDTFENVTNAQSDLFDNFTNFDAQSDFFDKFNGEGGASGEGAAGAYLGVGNALAAQLGAEGQGGQFAVMLAEALNHGLDGLRDFVQAAGLTFEQVQQANLDLAKGSEISWLEAIGNINAAWEAFQPGVEAVGDWGAGLDKLIDSAGTGQKAIGALVTTAIEGMEAGLTTTAQLIDQMRASGKYTDEFINGLEASFASNGITSLEQIVNATDQGLGSMVASLDAWLQDSGSSWSTMAENMGRGEEQLSEINQAADDLDGKEINIDIKYNISTSGDDPPPQDPVANRLGNAYQNGNIMRFAKGGIIGRRTLFETASGMGLMGEAGPEAILPLTRINGALGVKADLGQGQGASYNPVIFNIDARGGSAGISDEIIRALEQVKDSAVSEAINAMSYSRSY